MPNCRDIRYYPETEKSGEGNSQAPTHRRRVVAPVLPTNLRGSSQHGQPSSLRIQVPEDTGLRVEGDSSCHLPAEESAGASNSAQDSPAQGTTGVGNSVIPDSNNTAVTEAAGVVNSAVTGSMNRPYLPPAGVVNSAAPRRHTVPPQPGPPATEEELLQTGEDPTMGDKNLLIRVTGQQPTSLRLHTIRDAWDALILHEVRETDQEAEQLKAQATQYPAGSRVWRILREEARRLEQHGTLTRVWLGNRAEPYIRHPQDN